MKVNPVGVMLLAILFCRKGRIQCNVHQHLWTSESLDLFDHIYFTSLLPVSTLTCNCTHHICMAYRLNAWTWCVAWGQKHLDMSCRRTGISHYLLQWKFFWKFRTHSDLVPVWGTETLFRYCGTLYTLRSATISSFVYWKLGIWACF